MTLEQAIAAIRAELQNEYDFLHGHKWTHEEMVNAIMKTITNHLNLVPNIKLKNNS